MLHCLQSLEDWVALCTALCLTGVLKKIQGALLAEFKVRTPDAYMHRERITRSSTLEETLLIDVSDPLKLFKAPGKVRGDSISGSVYQDAYNRLITNPGNQPVVCSNYPRDR
jgi:hypothetical protein